MAKRIKIGIPFSYNEGWIGGTYYIVNLIKALNLLNDLQKPKIIIFYKNKKGLDLLTVINYPYIKFEKEKAWRKLNLLQRIVNKFSRKLLKENIFDNRLNRKKINILFPANDRHYFKLIPDKQKLFWIPDFQDYYLPELFTKEEIEKRKKNHKNLVARNVNIVFSSKSALCDFNEIYPENKNKTSVVQFAVSSEKEYEKIDIEKLLNKFNLPKNYFICSNQFWAHKNHIIVLKAIKILKKNNNKCHIVFTGNTTDYRNPDFYQSLLDYIKKEQLDEYVSFLGFIDRNEQLKLMSEAIAVIQPSNFEGWGTVVEDAKSMNKYIILSDIEVHKEQCEDNFVFFDRTDEETLSDIIVNIIKKQPITKEVDYNINRLKFAETFLNTITKSL